jgi:EAL domain-containing protein (putative c-di-GMP-specific phosphodiesterase class I)
MSELAQRKVEASFVLVAAGPQLQKRDTTCRQLWVSFRRNPRRAADERYVSERVIRGLLNVESSPIGLERVLQLAHDHLGLDAVHIAELETKNLVFRAVAGDARSFGVDVGTTISAADSYSKRLVDGVIPGLIPDSAREPTVASLPVTERYQMRAYIGVPLQLSDGSIYGTLSAVNHAPDPTLGERDLRFMSMLGALIVADLEAERSRQKATAELSELIATTDVQMVFQPVVDLCTGTVLGVEALARFPVSFGPPEQLFASAERLGLGLELERLTISEAWKELERMAPEQFVTFNVSPQSLLQLAKVAQKRPDVPLSQVVVEVTEQTIVENYGDLRDVLGPLRDRGLRVAVDDAGAGYASLRHIVELRPDFIKIDRSLVHGVADDEVRQVAIEALVLLSQSLGVTIIAEGVEHARELLILRGLGVHAGQGHLFGRPRPGQVKNGFRTHGTHRQLAALRQFRRHAAFAGSAVVPGRSVDVDTRDGPRDHQSLDL